MIFTQEQIDEIGRRLAQKGTKDTDFADATLPLTGKETLAIVQNGHNVQLPLEEVNDYKDITGQFEALQEDYTEFKEDVEQELLNDTALRFIDQEKTDYVDPNDDSKSLYSNMDRLLEAGIYQKCRIGRPAGSVDKEYYTLETLKGYHIENKDGEEEAAANALTNLYMGWEFDSATPVEWQEENPWPTGNITPNIWEYPYLEMNDCFVNQSNDEYWNELWPTQKYNVSDVWCCFSNSYYKQHYSIYSEPQTFAKFKRDLPAGEYNITINVWPSSTGRRDAGVSLPARLPSMDARVLGGGGGEFTPKSLGYTVENFIRTEAGESDASYRATFRVVHRGGNLEILLENAEAGYNWYVFRLHLTAVNYQDAVTDYEIIPQVCLSQMTGNMFSRMVYTRDKTKFGKPYTFHGTWEKAATFTELKNVYNQTKITSFDSIIDDAGATLKLEKQTGGSLDAYIGTPTFGYTDVVGPQYSNIHIVNGGGGDWRCDTSMNPSNPMAPQNFSIFKEYVGGQSNANALLNAAMEVPVSTYYGVLNRSYEANQIQVPFNQILSIIGATNETYKLYYEESDGTRTEGLRGNTDGWHTDSGAWAPWSYDASSGSTFYLQEGNTYPQTLSFGRNDCIKVYPAVYQIKLVYVNTVTGKELPYYLTVDYNSSTAETHQTFGDGYSATLAFINKGTLLGMLNSEESVILKRGRGCIIGYEDSTKNKFIVPSSTIAISKEDLDSIKVIAIAEQRNQTTIDNVEFYKGQPDKVGLMTPNQVNDVGSSVNDLSFEQKDNRLYLQFTNNFGQVSDSVIPESSTTASGAMSAQDKSLLTNSLKQATLIQSNTSHQLELRTTTNANVGSGQTFPTATSEANGLMSYTDKRDLTNLLGVVEDTLNGYKIEVQPTDMLIFKGTDAATQTFKVTYGNSSFGLSSITVTSNNVNLAVQTGKSGSEYNCAITTTLSLNDNITINGSATIRDLITVNLAGVIKVVDKIYYGFNTNPQNVNNVASIRESYKGEYKATSTSSHAPFYILIPYSMIGSISVGSALDAKMNGIGVNLICSGDMITSGSKANYYPFSIGVMNGSTFIAEDYPSGTELDIIIS